MFCRSFSYSHHAHGCGTYDRARATAPANVYIKPTAEITEDGRNPSWIYYERKTEDYKMLENKVNHFDEI